MSRLHSDDLARIAPHLTPIALPQRMRLVSPGEPIERCYFLESGVASVVTTTADGKHAEVGIIGREGMVDVAAVMGGERTPLEIFIQISGDGFVVPRGEVVALFDDSRAFRHLMLGFAHSFLIQVSQTALATIALTIEDRLARWLLMCCDRSDSDTLSVTHELMSLMLGVRRAGVTDALNSLVAAGYVSTTRGQITIVSRAGLEARAGGIYGVPEADHRMLITG